MGRFIVFNEKRTILVVCNNLVSAVKLVAGDISSGFEEEIFAFDTYLHEAYSWRESPNGFNVVELEADIFKFRNFATGMKTTTEIYQNIVKF